MPNTIDYSYTPTGQQLSTSGGGGGFGGGGGTPPINWRAYEAMLREQAERSDRRANQDRDRNIAMEDRAYQDAQQRENLADSREGPFRRLALQGAQRQNRLAAREGEALTHAPAMRTGLGGMLTPDETRMSGIQKQIHLPVQSGFGGYTPTGREVTDAAQEEREFYDEDDEEQPVVDTPDERFRKQNPYLSGMLGPGSQYGVGGEGGE